MSLLLSQEVAIPSYTSNNDEVHHDNYQFPVTVDIYDI